MLAKKMLVVVGMLLLCSLPGRVFADNEEVVGIAVILETGMQSNFTNGILQFTHGLDGLILMKDASPITFGSSLIQADFTGVTDYSDNGIAKAAFNQGTWAVTLYNDADRQQEMLHIEGTLDWFTEEETSENFLFGRGKLVPTPSTFTYNPVYFYGPISWEVGNDGKSGLNTNTSNIDLVPLTNFASNFSSSNVMAYVWADTANLIPEPATMVLLFAGAGMFFFRNRRK